MPYKIFWTDFELIPEPTSLQCNWKGNQKGKGTDETPLRNGLTTLCCNIYIHSMLCSISIMHAEK